MSGRGARRIGLLVSVVLLSELLGACGGAVGAILDTQQALKSDGYQSVHVGIASPNSLNVGVTVAAAPSQSDEDMVASVVWAKFHERFDYCNITVHGEGTAVKEELSFADMQNQFGPRDPSWNRTTIRGSAVELVVIVIGVVAAVVVGIVVLVILAKRRRRRRNPPWAPYPGQPWAAYGQPQYPSPDQYTQAPHPAQDQWAPPGQGPPAEDDPAGPPA